MDAQPSGESATVGLGLFSTIPRRHLEPPCQKLSFQI
jgi:hypothetical protein